MCYLNPIDTEDIQVIKSGDLVPGDIVKVPLAQTKVIYIQHLQHLKPIVYGIRRTLSLFSAIQFSCKRFIY